MAASAGMGLAGDILFQKPQRLQAGGTEITGYRDYSPGDDVRNVDWNYCARLDELIVREYGSVSRRFCHIIVDKSASMRMRAPKSNVSKLDLSARLAAILAYTALKRNQQVAFGAYDSVYYRMGRPMVGLGDIGFGLKFLQEQLESAGGLAEKSTCFLKAAEGVIAHDSRKGSVLVLTDLFDSSFEKGLSLLQQAGYSPRVLRLYTDHERGVGLFGDVTIQNAETGETWDLTITPSQLAYFQKKFQENTEKTRRWCSRFGARYQNVYCDLPASQACLQALGLKD